MLDAAIRRVIDRPLDRAGQWLAARGLKADHITLAGFATGIAAFAAIATGHMGVGLSLIVLNRLGDGLDGAVARATARTDRGAFLDIVLDFVFYAAIPVAFAILDPTHNGVAAAVLLGSFLANGGAFFAFALMAERRGLTTSAQGEKSLYYLAGLAEGSETIAVFVAFCLFPSAFPAIAIAFAIICVLSAIGRLVMGWIRLV